MLNYQRRADDPHTHLLTPTSALSGILADSRQGPLQGAAPEYANMSPEEFEALLQEMEPDIRAADRDMREIELLERKGVTGAGKLAGVYFLSWFAFSSLVLDRL